MLRLVAEILILVIRVSNELLVGLVSAFGVRGKRVSVVAKSLQFSCPPSVDSRSSRVPRLHISPVLEVLGELAEVHSLLISPVQLQRVSIELRISVINSTVVVDSSFANVRNFFFFVHIVSHSLRAKLIVHFRFVLRLKAYVVDRFELGLILHRACEIGIKGGTASPLLLLLLLLLLLFLSAL